MRFFCWKFVGSFQLVVNLGLIAHLLEIFIIDFLKVNTEISSHTWNFPIGIYKHQAHILEIFTLKFISLKQVHIHKIFIEFISLTLDLPLILYKFTWKYPVLYAIYKLENSNLWNVNIYPLVVSIIFSIVISFDPNP